MVLESYKRLRSEEKALDAALKSEGFNLTVPQAAVLESLLRLGTLAMNEVADSLGVTPGCMTGLLSRLDGAGFIERTRNAADQREWLVGLTLAGRIEAERLMSTVFSYAA